MFILEERKVISGQHGKYYERVNRGVLYTDSTCPKLSFGKMKQKKNHTQRARGKGQHDSQRTDF